MRRIAMTAAMIALVFGAGACGSSEPAADDAPWGLASVPLPGDEPGIEAVIAAMPQRVAGLERSEGTEGIADYGDGAGVMGFRLGPVAEDTPAGTAREYLSLVSAGKVVVSAGEFEIEEESLDGPLAYLVFNRIAFGRHDYLVAFGAPDSEIVFLVSAGSPGDREELIRAFVEAASGA